jgi:hypothetical protein
VAEVKSSESDANSESESEPERGRQITDTEPSSTISTTKLQPGEPDEPEEGECLFHSQMSVKGTPLHFIIDRGSQKNLISAEVIKQLSPANNTTPKTLHHWMAPPRKRSPHQPIVSTVVQHQALQR